MHSCATDIHVKSQRSMMALAGMRTRLGSLAVRREAARRTLSSSCNGAFRTIAYGSVPPAPSMDHPCWSEDLFPRGIDVKRQIFCNRSLSMPKIKAVGFDMDYTLAQYKPETFEALAHEQTVHKLVQVFGYPSELYNLPFDWTYMMRGLVIDKTRGNVLKIDRHKYVKVAYHGFQQFTSSERQAVYETSAVRDSYDEPAYAMIDTLFSLAEAHLFMRLVELMDSSPSKLQGKKYSDVYRDVRAAVDMVHRDGSLKRAVAADPAKYIHKDDRLLTVLGMLRESGKKVFLATNSLWDYTHVVMNFLLAGATGRAMSLSWLSHFDVVITGCGKPAFFSSKQPLFEVDTATGKLSNTDNGAPTTALVPLYEEDLPAPQLASSASCYLGGHSAAARVFQEESDIDGPDVAEYGLQKDRTCEGGTFVDLHKMLSVSSGAEVLYVGDHIYGDILRSKKSLGWRTMLVVPELENELALLHKHKEDFEELRLLRQQREALDDQVASLQYRLRKKQGCQDQAAEYSKLHEVLEAVQRQQAAVKAAHASLLQAHHEDFHPVWGRLLKTGYQNSRFAHQVERFACLYTSHVSNMALYSPDKSFKAREDHMAHEDGALHPPTVDPLDTQPSM